MRRNWVGDIENVYADGRDFYQVNYDVRLTLIHK